MATPVTQKEPMSALLPHLSDPWPSRYSPLADTLALVDDVQPCGMSPRNPSQTSNPAVVNPRSISSPPITSVVARKPSSQMVSVHSNIGGQPLA